MSCVRLFKKMLRGWKKEKGKLPIEVPTWSGSSRMRLGLGLITAGAAVAKLKRVGAQLSFSLSPSDFDNLLRGRQQSSCSSCFGSASLLFHSLFSVAGQIGWRTDGRTRAFLFVFFPSLSTLVPYTYPSSNDPPPSISLTYFSMQCAQTEAKTECRIENSYLCGHFFRLFNVSRSLPHSLPMLVSSVPVLLYYWSSLYLSFSVLFLLNK